LASDDLERGAVDVLQSGNMNPSCRIEPPQVRHILDYARRNYKAICADLSGNMELYSIEILHEATRIFLVCTPEIPSLHLAREKLNFLHSLEIGRNVDVLMNRAQKRGMVSLTEIERLLGHKVLMSFPNDYKECTTRSPWGPSCSNQASSAVIQLVR
jgi:Flp pilus assembly CpaE family ATPase